MSWIILYILDKQDIDMDEFLVSSNISLRSTEQLLNQTAESSLSNNSSIEIEDINDNSYPMLLQTPR
jgi:hypothetical protein